VHQRMLQLGNQLSSAFFIGVLIFYWCSYTHCCHDANN